MEPALKYSSPLTAAEKGAFLGRFTQPNLNEADKKLLVQVKERVKFHTNYYQIVTSQNARFIAFQILIKELYKQTHGNPQLKGYKFIRYPNPTLPKRVDEFFGQYGLPLSDHEEHIRSQITSNSFSIEQTLEGDNEGETTLEFYLRGKGVEDVNLLEALRLPFHLEGYDIDNFSKEIEEYVAQFPPSSHGMLIQTFFHKDYPLDEAVYIAHNEGKVCYCYLNKYKSVKDVFEEYNRGATLRCADLYLSECDQTPQIRHLPNSHHPVQHDSGRVRQFRYSTIDRTKVRELKRKAVDLIAKVVKTERKVIAPFVPNFTRYQGTLGFNEPDIETEAAIEQEREIFLEFWHSEANQYPKMLEKHSDNLIEILTHKLKSEARERYKRPLEDKIFKFIEVNLTMLDIEKNDSFLNLALSRMNANTHYTLIKKVLLEKKLQGSINLNKADEIYKEALNHKDTCFVDWFISKGFNPTKRSKSLFASFKF